MKLNRLGGASFEKEEGTVFHDTIGGLVQVFFRNFGLGENNTSQFRVDIAWSDVELLIEDFAEMGEAKAVELKKAKSLAVAARTAGWSPDH